MKFFLFLSLFFLNFIYADVYVSGYTRSNGTYVSGHYRSSPNHTKLDNFSTYGNVNPYTGKIGTNTYSDYNNYGRSSSNSYKNTNSLDYDSYDSGNIDEEVTRILSSIKSRNSQSNNIILKRKCSFQVKVIPTNALVQIMNIKPKFYNGIKLKKGSYRIKVSKKGYITSDKWIKLKRDKIISIILEKDSIKRISNHFIKEQKDTPMYYSNLNYVTMGSNKDDVLSVQGTPKSINKYTSSETWRYADYSTIEFKQNRVHEWTNNGNLYIEKY